MKHVMKVFAAILIVASVACYATAAEVKQKGQPKGIPAVKQETVAYSGKVLQTMNSGGYSYVYLQEESGRKLWLAVPESKTKIKVGGKASFAIGAEMKNFESKTLKRTFDSIIFSNGLIAQKNPGNSATSLDNPGSKGAVVAEKKVKVAKATDSEAHTVAELFAFRQKLAGEKVVVRGKIVKVTPNIMKMNWLHIQDGTGTAARKNHDLVVTTKALPSEGEVVTVSGTLLKDKDFGSGYKYDILLDNAEVKH
jgi:RNase P/RNase MRP subunit p29